MVAVPSVLVVDEEPETQRLLRVVLSEGGYRPLLACTVAEARTVVSKRRPDIVLVDPHRRDGGGDVLRELRREWPRQPILVVSRRALEPSIVAALEVADDYITKPFGPGELLARIRVALRRTRRSTSPKRTEPVLVVGDLRLDLDRHLVFVGSRQVHLTPTEYRIFTYLMRHPGKVITHPQLLKEVWGAPFQSERPYLRVYMGQLRKKLEREPAAPRYLRTEPGIGYLLEAPR